MNLSNVVVILEEEEKNESSNFLIESECEDQDGEVDNQVNEYGCTCRATALIVDDNPFNLIPLKMTLLD